MLNVTDLTIGNFFATHSYGQVCKVTKVTPKGVSYVAVTEDGTVRPARRGARNWKSFDEIEFAGETYENVQAQKKATELRQNARQQAVKDIRGQFAVEVEESGLKELLEKVANKVKATVDAQYNAKLAAISEETGIDLSDWATGVYIPSLTVSVEPQN